MAITHNMMNIFIKMLHEISQVIRQARKARGLSQQQLADLVYLDRTTIGALERNDYQDLGIRKVERVLTVLGKTLNCEDVGMPTLDDLVKANERS
uniref:Transcriptional regulator n=1 Tax=uncultured Thiotrichaceae bacterium TaxID=298394 RepID=A0A6S6UIM0_9GAMM|nr:MAG: Transcriptional regulator [uncultured Thiotrichaceae bacterium]